MVTQSSNSSNQDYSLPPDSSADNVAAIKQSFAQGSSDVFESFMSLDTYLKSSGDPTVAFRTQVYAQTTDAFAARASQYLAIAQQSVQLSQAVVNITDAVNSWTTVYNDQQSQVSAVTTYNNGFANNNSAGSKAVSDLKAAIAAYNSDQSTANSTALDTAVANYNSVVGPLVTAYNGTVTNYNTQMDTIPSVNTALDKAQIPDIPTQTHATNAPLPSSLTRAQALAATFPTSNKVTLATTIPVPPSLQEAIATYFPALAQGLLNGLSDASQKQRLQDALADLLFDLNPTDPVLPKAYINRVHQMLFDGSSGDAVGTGVAMIAHTVHLNTRLLSRVILKGLQDGLSKETQKQLPAQSTNLLQLFVANSFSKAVLASAEVPSLQIKLPSSVDPAGAKAALDLESGLAIADTVRSLVSSDVLRENLVALIGSSPEFASLSAAEKQALLKSVGTAINLGLLKLALGIVSSSLHLPGLSTQIIGGLTGAPPISELTAATPAKLLNQALDNPIAQLSLKQSLLEELVKLTNVSSDAAAAVIQKAVNPLLLDSSPSTISEFTADLEKSLNDQGVQADISKELAVTAAIQLQREVTIPLLDRSFVSAQIDKAQVLLKQGAGEITSEENQKLQDQLSKVKGSDLESNRQFADTIQKGLIDDGVEKSRAGELSTLATRLVVAPTPIPTSPLNQLNPSKLLSPAALSESLTASIVDKFKPITGELSARETADRTTSLLIGSNSTSIRTLLNDQVRNLKNEGNDNSVTQFFNQADTIQPTLPLYALTGAVTQVVKKSVGHYMDPQSKEGLMTQNMLKSRYVKPELEFTV